MHEYLKKNQANIEYHDTKLPLRRREGLLPGSNPSLRSIMTGVESVQLCVLCGFSIVYSAV